MTQSRPALHADRLSVMSVRRDLFADLFGLLDQERYKDFNRFCFAKPVHQMERTVHGGLERQHDHARRCLCRETRYDACFGAAGNSVDHAHGMAELKFRFFQRAWRLPEPEVRPTSFRPVISSMVMNFFAASG